MGVLNVTPDSFSDGGRYFKRATAIAHGLRLLEEGADILDIGGESTRPGAPPVPAEEEMERVIPVIEAIRSLTPALISIDTFKASVARAAAAAGVDIVNDISGFKFDPALAEAVRQADVPVILMHLRGTPQTMHQLPDSPDIMQEIETGLQESLNVAQAHGVSRAKILVDPGIGFGKNPQENLMALNRLARLQSLDRPLVVGTSRKSFIGALLNQPTDQRLMGSIASAAAAVHRGAHVVRVHDVRPMAEVLRVLDAISAEKLAP
ncbi:MAG: dihydropteroate synthase [Acidobacteria bacterium]|nr:dihydropteroate synthase [Acidobacteriota bacterium]MBI3656522.1 dihydropteroate synthase [Acidobacteriota bacterium]